MNSFKSFDLFPKIIIDNETKSTKLGVFLTISLTVLLGYLLIREIQNFLTNKITKEIIVKNDINSKPYITLNFQIEFYSTPCALISLDFENLLGIHKMNIKENIEFFRMSNEKILEGEYSPYKLNLLEESINKNEYCIVQGFYYLEKSPADLHFSYHHFKDVYDNLMERFKGEGLYKKLNLAHKIRKFSFVNNQELAKIKKNFSGSKALDLVELLNKHESNNFNFPDFVQDKAYDNKNGKVYFYEYYFKLIPYVFFNENTKEEFSIYLYSMTFSRNERKDKDEEMPLVILNYDFSPISMRFVLKGNSFTSFLINICALVGGVVVCFKILFNFLSYWFVR